MRASVLLFLLFQAGWVFAAPEERPVLRAISISAAFGDGRIDINKADARELSERLTGVGEKKALAIISYRKEHGPFRSLRDLERVKGIGPSLVKKNRHLLFVSER